MSRNLTLMLVSTAAAALMLPACAQDEPKPEPIVTFTYAPPAPLSYTETITTRRTTLVATVEPVEEVSTLVRKMSIQPAPDGYTIVSEPTSFRVTRGDKEVSDPVLDLIQKAKLTYSLDKNGKLTKVAGLEGLGEQAAKAAPKEHAKAINKMLSPETLEVRERAQWESGAGLLIGQTANRNSAYIGEGAMSLPDGTNARFYVVNLVTAMVEQDGRKLVKVKVLLTDDLERLPRMINDLARDVVTGYTRPRPLPAVAGFKISGTGERLIDPTSMIIYSDKLQRDIQVTMSSGKDEVQPVLVQEQRESRVTRLTR